MTHTAHPYAHRLGIIRGWRSRWFAGDKKSYRENIQVDETIRRFLTKRLRGSYTSSIEIERSASELHVVISTARPGIVIGRSGENAAKLRKELAAVVRTVAPDDRRTLKLDVNEIRQAEADAAVVAYMVAEGLEKRMPFRRVLKQTIEKVMAVKEVEGVRIAVSGRLGGADMSRKEQLRKGRIPLQTFAADIDFAQERAYLSYGVIGIKVWIYKGNIYDKKTVAKPLAQRVMSNGQSA
ncbi:30S ribosomal protein S3 [Candidatus Kaiserbacteria bacterium CG10_big_fil_rev_8_21_14_0_10_56_12]|uniref:Small ribosomal subunit protein uS3 n=1 Tax=Candidatus Kaiserbacteria bacterium CG10_big_fil_rev_8_21_14_0_10_56_12 TaxID=1974611 RepID=A0A2H0U9E9_9BACT|nr:MAG: 30S ribosomal protein S3 [Candidatus Kaiserbacteria bacterium CG10_big_fil_rev_8_21_14_0_10_56_12]